VVAQGEAMMDDANATYAKLIMQVTIHTHDC
jgi:hypothetical protein